MALSIRFDVDGEKGHDYDRILHKCRDCNHNHLVALECPPPDAKEITIKRKGNAYRVVDEPEWREAVKAS